MFRILSIAAAVLVLAAATQVTTARAAHPIMTRLGRGASHGLHALGHGLHNVGHKLGHALHGHGHRQ